ncbi:MAG: hypothetical protein LBU32_09500 [Clostridiales bacterium]|jgi:hypothetical protein|nr:hypothetical protein [Clostridiales bacterium]
MVYSDMADCRARLSGAVEVDEACIGGEGHGESSGRGAGSKALPPWLLSCKSLEAAKNKG